MQVPPESSKFSNYLENSPNIFFFLRRLGLSNVGHQGQFARQLRPVCEQRIFGDKQLKQDRRKWAMGNLRI